MVIQPSRVEYERPSLPTEVDLQPSYRPRPPPSACDKFLWVLHAYHRVFAVSMFSLCISILIWGGLHGINLRDRNATISP